MCLFPFWASCTSNECSHLLPLLSLSPSRTRLQSVPCRYHALRFVRRWPRRRRCLRRRPECVPPLLVRAPPRNLYRRPRLRHSLRRSGERPELTPIRAVVLLSASITGHSTRVAWAKERFAQHRAPSRASGRIAPRTQLERARAGSALLDVSLVNKLGARVDQQRIRQREKRISRTHPVHLLAQLPSSSTLRASSSSARWA